MSAQHTPGPWKADHAHMARADGSGWQDFKIVGQDGKSICSCSTAVKRDMEEKLANARLIAAAPDLLNALVALANTAESRGIPVDAARAAIARVTGN